MKKMHKVKESLSVYASCVCSCSCSCISCATSVVPNDDVLKIQLRKSNVESKNQSLGRSQSYRYG